MTMSRPTDSVLEYPCEFGIKVFGKTAADFKETVIKLIEPHVSDSSLLTTDGAISEKTSKDGNYNSITVTIQAQSKQQLDAIYQALSDEPKVLLAL